MARPRARPALLALLGAADAQRDDLALASFPDAQIRWAVASALGPLLLRAGVRDPHVPVARYWATLHGADLAARVQADVQIEATAEIIDACGPHVDVTLLKGISLAERDY